MTDGLSAPRREEREEEEEQRLRRQQQDSPTDPPKKPQQPKKRKRAVYDFPDSPDRDEEADHDHFVSCCLDRVTGTVEADVQCALEVYTRLLHFGVFPLTQMESAERTRVILDLADRVTAERLREQRRRCSASVCASMQQA
tara:strand:- start:2373 stop:2795 length:423 start_codon:yes stop_codon:yes gene_type:complete